jgi:serine/threonine protein kinase
MKWADFGFSKRVNENGTFTMSGVKGTFNWLAPEILILLNEDSSTKNEAQNRGTVKSDVFAEGLVFGYFLLGGVHPFGAQKDQIPMNIRTNKRPNLPGMKNQLRISGIPNNFAVKHKFRIYKYRNGGHS